MSVVSIPKGMPDCFLLRTLFEKASERHDTNFDFAKHLSDLRERVSGEVRFINQLFPEYTPHDEQYHLSRLFHVADTILGDLLIESMNSGELFVLACALYGHDWGMAVSEVERGYITAGTAPDAYKKEDFWVLPNEQDQFRSFTRKERLSDEEITANGVPDLLWREYIRQTHAYRSGERIQRFFEHVDGGVADAASRVSVGHWLDFPKLNDYNSYPSGFSLLRETINLRALAVYVRLIDLLDIAEDRTPYVIWKFVAPRNKQSQMEWQKHRALRPVTCPIYHDGRVIQVDGRTNDHEVFAALQDLKSYCDAQLRGCLDVLARMNDANHKLDLRHIDWRVTANGFDPVLIRFEFDRNSVFHILSDEIYQGDRYVFLRELLQNSIDAIRMRREVLKRHRACPADLGLIQVGVKHLDNGDAIITWQDDGIGMDDYIVRNYLAVAGKSYYQSEDFQRESLQMDPISRFGVGILSCFMVAEHIQIETRKDPYMQPPGYPLRITVPAVDKQFRIERLTPDAIDPGTKVTVYIDGTRLHADEETKQPKKLDIIGYLTIVAGFVEFPIVIEDGERKVVIVHPYTDALDLLSQVGSAYAVHKLDLAFDWESSTIPQDLSKAREYFKEVRLDLASDLKVAGHLGCISYLVPASEDIEIVYGSASDHSQTLAEIVRPNSGLGKVDSVRWHDPMRRRYQQGDRQLAPLAPSADHGQDLRVYRDGILLPRATLSSKESYNYCRNALPNPQIVVNIPKAENAPVDIARTTILGNSGHWYKPINDRIVDLFHSVIGTDIAGLPPKDRYLQLARFLFNFDVDAMDYGRIVSSDMWPVPFVTNNGQIEFKQWRDVASNDVRVLPADLGKMSSNALKVSMWGNMGLSYQLSAWRGDDALIRDLWDLDEFGSLETMSSAVGRLLRSTHYVADGLFVQSVRIGEVPLLQEIWRPINGNSYSLDAALGRAIDDPFELTAFQRYRLVLEYQKQGFRLDFFDWPHHAKTLFAHGRAINRRHPAGLLVFRFTANLIQAIRSHSLSRESIGRCRDALQSVERSTHYYRQRNIPPSIQGLAELAVDIGLIRPKEKDDVVISSEQFRDSGANPDYRSLPTDCINPAFGRQIDVGK